MKVERRLAPLLVISVLAACGSGRAPSPIGPRTLPPDSAAMLAAALAMVRPAYATQEEALASTLYSQGPSVAGNTPPPQMEPVVSGGSARYVIQVAAFFDRAVAESAADLARHRFPDFEVLIEEAADVLRVAVGPWPSQRAAQSMLPTVRSHYPDAWVRVRASP